MIDVLMWGYYDKSKYSLHNIQSWKIYWECSQ
jgi:hypothetical protein